LKEGRTYAGGLTKFEPREMERLLVPSPELLGAMLTA
jgi:adenine-specific DNA-methyltransferase